MEERPGSGSDMPKPRNKVTSDSGLPPLRPTNKIRNSGTQSDGVNTSGKRSSGAKSSGSGSSGRRVSSHSQYASDTAEFYVPAEEDYLYDDPRTENFPPRRQPSYRRQPAPKRRSRPRRPDYVAAPPRAARPRRRSFLGRLVRFVVTLAVVVFIVYSAAALLLISKLEKNPEGERTYTSGTLHRSYVRSILLIGTDSRDLTQERGRSDSMILLTLNSATSEITMNSFMRDAYVEIPGHGSNKLNAAYSLGGAELLMDTLERNYDVSVDDYLCVSFTGFAGIIDAFGGVEITLTEEEAQAINVILQSEVNALLGDDPMADFLPGGGTFVLDGKQALSYSRIRYVGNADFERTSRQREVMTELITSAKSRALTAVPDLMKSALPNVSTNMSTTELYLLSLRVPLLFGYDLRQQQIPADGTWSGATIGGQSVLQVDCAANTQILRETAYAASRSEQEAQ